MGVPHESETDMPHHQTVLGRPTGPTPLLSGPRVRSAPGHREASVMTSAAGVALGAVIGLVLGLALCAAILAASWA